MRALLEADRIALSGRLGETSLTLRAGELTCLIGPNGSGKTSLLHAIAGIGGPSGSVWIDVLEPRRLAPAQRQRLFSFLPATRDVRWPVTARDLIALGTQAPQSEVRIAELLAQMELTELADRRVDRMSTGERSRVLIARALAADPKVLLLDEPVANLDPLWQLRLMDGLQRQALEAGQAMLIAIHDLQLALHYPSRLIIMDQGAVVADGDPRALLEGPEIPRVFGIERTGGRWRPIN